MQISEFGEWIRAKRKAKKWSQDKLAVKSGYSIQFICFVENNQRTPSFKAMEDIAYALGHEINFELVEVE